MKRKRYSGVKHAFARCSECTWMGSGPESLGAAARHHDDTGHTVTAEQTITVTYTRPGSRYDAAHQR